MTELNLPSDAVTVTERTSEDPRDHFADLAAVVFPALLTLGLCLYRIGSRQPWQDEHATWIGATRSFDGFLRLIQHVDFVLAPYYLAMRGWSSIFGDSISGMRVPSALAMAGSAALISLLGRRLFDRQVGLVASMIFALLPVVSRYGQEARPSALATFGVLLSTLLFLRAFGEDAAPTLGRCAVYAVSISFVGLTHLVALSVLAAHLVRLCEFRRGVPPAVLRVSRDRLLTFALSVTVGLLAVLPLIVYGRQQTGQLHEVDLNLISVFPLYGQLFLPAAVRWLLVALAVVGMTRRNATRAMLITWALLPPIWLFASYEILHIFRARYLIFTLPAWALLAALALVQPTTAPRKRWLIVGSALALFLVLGAEKQLSWREPTLPTQNDFRGAAAQMAQRAQPGDAVAYAGKKSNALHARRAVLYELRAGPQLRDIFARQTAEQADALSARECPVAAPCLPPDVRRIWLLTDARQTYTFEDMPTDRARLLEERFAEVFHWKSHDTELVLLQRKP